MIDSVQGLNPMILESPIVCICNFKPIDFDELDKQSVSSFYYKGYKYGASRLGRQSSRLSNYSWIASQKHGIPSPQKQNINDIMNHSFVYENLKNQGFKNKILKKVVLIIHHYRYYQMCQQRHLS